jgi:hypothetical protein
MKEPRKLRGADGSRRRQGARRRGSPWAALARLAARRPPEAELAREAGDMLGYVLTYRGGDLGEVYETTTGDDAQPAMLRARGGISGALEYQVPVDAVVSVDAGSRRAEVEDGLTFDTDRPTGDGDILLRGHLDAPRDAAGKAWDARRFEP